MITAKKIVRYGSISLIVVIVLGYGIWQSRDLLFGISTSITGISDGLSTNNPLLDFGGNAYHANALVINGRTVPLTGNGSWNDTIALLPGYNTIDIQITDRFKRTTEKIYRVYYTK
jgi:hypothetical protein